MDNVTIGNAVGRNIDASARNRASVAEAVHMAPSALSRSISGERTFKSVELAWIADLLGLSIDELVGRKTLPFMAAARAKGSADAHVDEELSGIARTLFERRSGLAQLGVGDAPSFPRIPNNATPEQLADLIVQHIRQFVGDGVLADVDDLASAIETAFGIDVWVRDLPEGIDGYCIHATDDQVYGIIASTRTSPQRTRFTIAHELAHLVCGDNTLNQPHVIRDGSDDPIERRAHTIASGILMPRDKMLQPHSWTAEKIAEQAYKYRVAPSAFAARVKAGIYQEQLPTLAGAWPDALKGDATFAVWKKRNSAERKPKRLIHDLAVAYADKKSTVRPFALVAGFDDLDEARDAARGKRPPQRERAEDLPGHVGRRDLCVRRASRSAGLLAP